MPEVTSLEHLSYKSPKINSQAEKLDKELNILCTCRQKIILNSHTDRSGETYAVRRRKNSDEQDKTITYLSKIMRTRIHGRRGLADKVECMEEVLGK